MLFVMFTRLIGKEVHPSGDSLEELKQKVVEKISAACPNVEWIANYVLFSEYDYLDIFTASDLETAKNVGIIIRSFGHASIDILPALEWKHFIKSVSKLPQEKIKS